MALIDKGLELVQPYKNIKEMFDAFGKGDLVGGVKNYFESIPGVIGVTKFVVQGAPKVFVPGISKTIQVAATKATNWYISPAKALLNRGVVQPLTKASSTIGGVTAGLKATGVLASVAAIDHLVGRATKSRYISLFDAIGAGISGKPSAEVKKRIDNYKYERSGGSTSGLLSIGGNPLNMAILKVLRPSLFK